MKETAKLGNVMDITMYCVVVVLARPVTFTCIKLYLYAYVFNTNSERRSAEAELASPGSINAKAKTISAPVIRHESSRGERQFCSVPQAVTCLRDVLVDSILEHFSWSEVTGLMHKA